MAAEGRSYGDQLREARERKGIDLVSMARTLHIRPDIVGALENADFNKMPAHGYSKNMIRAYARHVGLDEVRISQLYAEERSRFEGAPLPSRSRGATGRSSAVPDRSRRLGEPSRRVPDAATREGRRSQSVSRRIDAPAREGRSRSLPPTAPERSSGFSDLVASLGRKPAQRESMVRSSFTQGGGQPSIASRSRGFGMGATRSLPAFNLPVILAVAGAIIVIIIAVILFNGGRQSVDDVPDIPISGLTDTSAVDEASQVPQLEAAPSSAVFSFSVEDGGQTWITVYQDGASTPVYAAVAEGPITEDFEVTGTLTFETANITPLTLTVDGEEVQAQPSATSTNYVYTVDFPSILAEWKRAHGVDEPDDDDQGSASSSSSASSSASTTSSGSRSASASEG